VLNHLRHIANKDMSMREGMTRTCLAQAASSQTLGTILTALHTGSLMEACFATRWLSFCLGDCRNFDAAGNG